MKNKLIMIIGSTATGKSKLAVELAEHFNTEIISADSIKVYKGLNIASAKILEEKRKNVKFHLLSIKEPQFDFTVNEFLKISTKIIEDLYSKNKVPIVSGGTFYYSTSLFTNNYMTTKNFGEEILSDVKFNDDKKIENYKYERLKKVDPKMASKLHPNDKRKIISSLYIYDKHKIPHSDLISKKGENNIKKDKDVLILWLYCQKEELNFRLDKRVDKMIENGLINEIFSVRKKLINFVKNEKLNCEKKLNCVNKNVNFKNLNICQAIGFKEFLTFFDEMEELLNFEDDFGILDFANKLTYFYLTDFDEKDIKDIKTKKLFKLYKESINQIKVRTKSYANYQLKWINKKILTENVKVFKFETTEKSKWNENVSVPSLNLCKKFLENEEIDNDEFRVKRIIRKKLEQFKCEKCQLEINGSDAWKKHIKGRKHKKKN